MNLNEQWFSHKGF